MTTYTRNSDEIMFQKALWIIEECLDVFDGNGEVLGYDVDIMKLAEKIVKLNKGGDMHEIDRSSDRNELMSYEIADYIIDYVCKDFVANSIREKVRQAIRNLENSGKISY